MAAAGRAGMAAERKGMAGGRGGGGGAAATPGAGNHPGGVEGAAATTVAADTTAGAMDGEPPVLRPAQRSAQRQPTGHRAIAPRTSGMATATFRRPSTSANSAKNVCYFSE